MHAPIIFAHRGASGYAFENTSEAFRKGIELGADGLEFDCWATKDGHVIIHHDKLFKDPETGDRLDLTLATLDEIKKLRLPNGEAIPTLIDFLHEFSHQTVQNAMNKGALVQFSIDIQDNYVGTLMLPILEQYHVLDRTYLCGSNLWKIRRVLENSNGYRLNLVISNQEHQITPDNLAEGGKIARLQIDAINIRFTNYHADYQKIIQNAGKRLFIWDLHTRLLLRKYMRLKPDAIFTNFPDLAVKIREELLAKELGKKI